MSEAGQVQARAERLLAECTRTPEPLAAEAAAAECWKCGTAAAARVSLRMDGVEMAWTYACAEHQDDEFRVHVSEW